jgi:deoxyribonucleoside regulator
MDENRLALLYKVAVMYYEQGEKKYRIASAINQSPTQVANLLKEAQEAGILRIRVGLPRLQVLEQQLKIRFGLRDAVVIPAERDCSLLLKNLAKAAAEYFEQNVPKGRRVALGGGYVLYEMIAALPERHRDIDIYPAAIVGQGPVVTHIDPQILVTLLWAKSGHVQGRAHYVTVTPPETGGRLKIAQDYYRQIQKNKRVKELLDGMRSVDLVFASVGELDVNDSYIAATSYTTRNLLHEMNLNNSELRREHAIGDIAYSFFDERGDSKPNWNLVTSLGIKHLKEMAANPSKSVVVVVGGYKQKSLTAILRGHICSVVITDADAAERVLKSG